MSFGSSFDDGAEMSDINMTPLIDVMLVLLIIFIITLPVLTHNVLVDLPQVNSLPSNDKPTVITLSINKEGEIFWNDLPLGFEEMETRLKSSAQKIPQPEIHIRGDKAVEYRHMIKTMAAAQTAGLTKLGFITEPVR